MSFQHDAQERLGAGVPDEEPALAGDARFDARDRIGDCRDRLQFHAFADAHVQQHLREGRQVRREIGQGAAGERDGPQNVQRGAQTVAREQVVGEDDVARLLAAERQVPLQHLLHHVLVADRGAHQVDAERLQRQLEPDVAHDGRDDRVAAKPPLALQLMAAHQQDRIAVDDLAAMIDEDRAIAVAVEGNAHRAAARHHQLRQLFRMGRSAAEVDVAAVGPIAHDDGLEAEAVEQLRPHRGRRAVGAVEHDREALDLGGLGKDDAEVIEVGVDQVRARHRARLAGVRAPGGVGHDRLDFALHLLGELLTLAGEHLDAVVLVWVVRSGNDHADVVCPGAGQEGHRRRRHDPGAGHRRAFAARPVRELRLDPRAGLAGVAADEELRRLGAVREGADQRRTEPPDGRRIERRLARRATNAVGTEQPVICHC